MGFRIHIEDEIIRAELSGIVTKDDFQALINEIVRLESGATKVQPRVIDLSAMLDSEYRFPEMMTLAEIRTAHPLPHAVKSAIVAPKPFQFGLARTYQTLNANPRLIIRLFPELPAALRWIAEAEEAGQS